MGTYENAVLLFWRQETGNCRGMYVCFDTSCSTRSCRNLRRIPRIGLVCSEDALLLEVDHKVCQPSDPTANHLHVSPQATGGSREGDGRTNEPDDTSLRPTDRSIDRWATYIDVPKWSAHCYHSGAKARSKARSKAIIPAKLTCVLQHGRPIISKCARQRA